MSEFTFGADPEVAVITKITKAVVSPALLVKNGNLKIGIYDDKHPVFIQNRKFKWIMDGVNFELTLIDPYDNPSEMYKTIKIALNALKDLVQSIRYKNEIQLTIKPTVPFVPGWYSTYLSDPLIYQGTIFGCDKDYDAIDPENEGEEIDVLNHPWRYCGGHMHLGVKDQTLLQKIHGSEEERIKVVQLMAIFAGNTAIKNSEDPNAERQRTFLYGRPGRYRPQPHGLEYRTPSNNWLLKEKYCVEVFEAMMKAVNAYKNNLWRELSEEFLPDTIHNILKCDCTNAEKLLKALK